MLLKKDIGDDRNTERNVDYRIEYTFYSKRILEMTETRNETSITGSIISSIFSDFDLYLFGQGRDHHVYEKMGSHIRTVDGVTGTNSATWPPNALAVPLIGDFN